MSPSQDPREGYVLESSDRETNRLEAQAALYGGLSFLEPLLTHQPRRVLDVGCGSGHFTRRVAERLPGAEVVGVDIDEGRLDFARAHSSNSNLRFKQGDFQGLGFPDGTFDLVFARFVLVHAADATGALREMARVTDIGGHVVAFDMVHQGIWFVPHKPALAEVLKATIQALRERGAEPDQGLHLPAGLLRAGLSQVVFQVVPYVAMSPQPIYDAYRTNWLDTVRSLRAMLAGRVAEAVMNVAEAELQAAEEGDLMVETTVVAHGKKPE